MTLAREDTSCTEVGRPRVPPRAASALGAHRKVQELEPMMNEHGKSDRPIVPGKSPNKAGVPGDRSSSLGWKAGQPAAEEMEGRGLAKGNLGQQNAFRTQGRVDAPSELAQIPQTAKSNKDVKFTALMHYIYRIDTLRFAYFQLKRQAAAGVDGETWRHYGEALEANLQNLSHRLKRGAYRAKPVRRVYIPKADGRQRPLGVTALEDKLVQRAAVEVLNHIYETDFLGFSYGFRPGRSQHQALDALWCGLDGRRVNWVLDLDVRSFFDRLSHAWLVQFLQHRIADRRVVRLIQKWLNAGVLEEGKRTQVEAGSPQGGSASPLLANLYLHYVFDLWVQAWRKKRAHGDVIVVRYADDIVVGFEFKDEAERFWAELKQRMQKFQLELHPEKTRLIEFGRHAAKNRNRAGLGKPETFNFLGFTHICGKTKKGRFIVLRQTVRKRMQAKLQEVKTELRRRMHDPVPEVGEWLKSVVGGHIRYFGVPGNRYALAHFRLTVSRLWHHVLRRRSQKGRVQWERMQRLIQRWLPPAHIYHPYPSRRLRVTT